MQLIFHLTNSVSSFYFAGGALREFFISFTKDFQTCYFILKSSHYYSHIIMSPVCCLFASYLGFLSYLKIIHIFFFKVLIRDVIQDGLPWLSHQNYHLHSLCGEVLHCLLIMNFAVCGVFFFFLKFIVVRLFV